MLKKLRSDDFIVLGTGAYLSETKPYTGTVLYNYEKAYEEISIPDELDGVSPLFVVCDPHIIVSPTTVKILDREPEKLQPDFDRKAYTKSAFPYSNIAFTCALPTSFDFVKGYLIVLTGLEHANLCL